jgi:hypothetical protein
MRSPALTTTLVDHFRYHKGYCTYVDAGRKPQPQHRAGPFIHNACKLQGLIQAIGLQTCWRVMGRETQMPNCCCTQHQEACPTQQALDTCVCGEGGRGFICSSHSSLRTRAGGAHCLLHRTHTGTSKAAWTVRTMTYVQGHVPHH